MAEKTCGTCRAIRSDYSEPGESGSTDKPVLIGHHCGKNAPRPVSLPVLSEDMDVIVAWPDVEPSDVACEEWAARSG